jgi:putative ABC transport system permease protein
VGDGVALAGRELRVAGIVNTGIRPVKADLYLNIQDAEELIQGRLRNPLASRFNVLLVEARSATVHERAMAEVRELVGDSSVLSTYACYRPAAAVLGSNERGILILLVTTCALVLAFAWKSQHASLVERRRELGVLRAIGWSDRDILAQLLIESVMLALLGCVAGCVLATAGLLATSLADVPRGVPSAGLRLSWQAYGSALLFALSGGTIAGLLPAAGALRKSASEMLRAL